MYFARYRNMPVSDMRHGDRLVLNYGGTLHVGPPITSAATSATITSIDTINGGRTTTMARTLDVLRPDAEMIGTAAAWAFTYEGEIPDEVAM